MIVFLYVINNYIFVVNKIKIKVYMVNNEKILKLIFLPLLLNSGVLSSQSLSFSEAQAVMDRDNSLIKAVQKEEEAYTYEWKASKGNRYPQLSVFGGGLYLNKELGTNLNGAKNEFSSLLGVSNPEILGDWDINILKRDIAFGGVGIIWPVFTGGKINALIESSKIKTDIGHEELVSTKNKLISELVERYFQVKLAEEAVLVRKEALEGMNKHLYDATKLEQQGIIAPVEKLQADVAVSEANRQYSASLKDLSLSKVALANTLEIDEANFDLTTQFFLVDNLQSLAYYQDKALTNYPELLKLKLQIDLAEQGIKSKKSSYYPTIDAFGQSVLLHNNPVGVSKKNEKPWMVGVTLTYDLFEGFKNKNEIKAAKVTKESAELHEIKAKKDIKNQIEKIYQDLEKQNEQIQNLQIQIVQAEELLRVRSRSFAEGIASSTDVVDAEVNLSGIKLQKLEAQYNYVLDLADLLEYSGLSYEFTQYAN